MSLPSSDPEFLLLLRHSGTMPSPAELELIIQRIDDIVRPYIGAVRDDAPDDAATVNLSLLALPKPSPGPRS